MFELHIGFPSGRYCAASHADPRLPEWPPHPSRVYSALVAGAYGDKGCITDNERHALNRLAQAGAPALAFPDADLSQAPDSYVPVNDEHSRLKPGKSFGVLEPNRQARQFPTAFMLGEPEIRLVWQDELPDEILTVLDGLAGRMTHVGTSHSFVAARFVRPQLPSAVRWVPDPQGRDYLRVPMEGRLSELDLHAAQRAELRQRDTLRRRMPQCEQMVPYAAAHRPRTQVIAARHDWITLRLDDVAWGADTARTLARAARRALMALIGDDAPAALHGHDDQIEHLAWLPLPDVGHTHARARLRGMAVGLPRSLAPADLAVLVRALSRLQLLHLPDGQTARVQPVVEASDLPMVLRQNTWCRASTEWGTVTPVILDRPPKRADPGLLLEAMVESITGAGYPRPVEVKLSRTSEFDGAPAALDIPTRLPRYHARVRFADLVEGPVIAGRWRNFGIGLFRPLAGGEQA